MNIRSQAILGFIMGFHGFDMVKPPLVFCLGYRARAEVIMQEMWREKDGSLSRLKITQGSLICFLSGTRTN
jgi:hypothetical protein